MAELADHHPVPPDPLNQILSAASLLVSKLLSIFAMSLLRRIRSQPQAHGPRGEAHMTWATRSMTQTVSRAGVFFRKQIWIWPIVAVLLLSIAGYYVRSSIESIIKGNLTSGLQTLVSIEVSMLENFFKVQRLNAETMANDVRVRDLAVPILLPQQRTDPTSAVVDAAEVSERLRAELASAMAAHDYEGFFVANDAKQIVAASHPSLIGQSEVAEYDSFLSTAIEGQSVVSAPFASVVMIRNAAGKYRVGQPTMFVAAPLRNAAFQVIGVLALQIRPEREFTRILQLGRLGETGETYAFNRDGVMVSNSRFDEEMILLGILPDHEETSSILNVMLRDPGGDLTQGFHSQTRRSKLPLTKMAQDAIAGNANVDVDGYRDYRGVPVVGAWKWLPEYGIGVATEIDVTQAFRPLVILQRVFWSLYTMLILCSISIFVFTVLVAHARRDAQQAAVQAQQLGQYTLEQKLGSGAMGTVYKGHHAMLRRPTAIKMLNIDKINDASITRFEREVKITCQLTHPNTIAIFDYGRTPEGVFYYAMEYIQGIDLQSLVMQYGAQPPSRVIHVLMQMCGSLFEAHTLGLVHRDIKPANTMLCRRGCQSDVVKVLDFGLVKAIDDDQLGSQGGGLTGTPLYMSPEAIQSPLTIDARSDLYAVGAVGYYLLTGKNVFEADSIVDLCRKQVDDAPLSPSRYPGVQVSEALEHAIMICLEKSRSKRPQTARELAQLLARCPEANVWTEEDGDRWWSRFERGESQQGSTATHTSLASASSPPSQTLPSSGATLADRSAVNSETTAFNQTIDG